MITIDAKPHALKINILKQAVYVKIVNIIVNLVQFQPPIAPVVGQPTKLSSMDNVKIAIILAQNAAEVPLVVIALSVMKEIF